jgi:hypothetical protein
VPASSVPVELAPICVYARLTDAAGLYAFVLDVVRRDDLVVVATFDIGTVEALDPLDDGEIFVHQALILLPSAGSYDVRLWANSQFIHSVSFRALA